MTRQAATVFLRVLILISAMLLFHSPATSAGTARGAFEPDSADTGVPNEMVPINTGYTEAQDAASDTVRTKAQASATTKKWTTEYEETERREGLARYLYFFDDGMSEAYTQCFGAMFNVVTYSRTNTRYEGRSHGIIENLAGRGEIGFLVANGTPLRWGTQFEVVESDIAIVALPLAVTVLHGLGQGREKSVTPYFGWGLGGIFGFERISGKVDRYNDEFEWHDTCYRQSFEGHALAGLQWNVRENLSGIIEVRWTQAGKGRLKRGQVSDADLAEGWGDVFTEFQHPNFSFTGASVDVGVWW